MADLPAREETYDVDVRKSLGFPGIGLTVSVDIDLGGGDACTVRVISHLTSGRIEVQGSLAQIRQPPPILAEAMAVVAAMLLAYPNVRDRWLESFYGRATCYAIAVSSYQGPAPSEQVSYLMREPRALPAPTENAK